jgi:hypothetical protein
MRRIPDFERRTLHGFIQESVDAGSTVCTDGLNSYRELSGYRHDRKVQRKQEKGGVLLSRVHLAISLFKRWMLGTLQGGVPHKYLDDYINRVCVPLQQAQIRLAGQIVFPLGPASRSD